MINETPKYEEYSREELQDVLRRIDREKYPDRVLMIQDALENSPPIDRKKEKSNDDKWLAIFVVGSIEIAFWLVLGLLAITGIFIF